MYNKLGFEWLLYSSMNDKSIERDPEIDADIYREIIKERDA